MVQGIRLLTQAERRKIHGSVTPVPAGPAWWPGERMHSACGQCASRIRAWLLNRHDTHFAARMMPLASAAVASKGGGDRAAGQVSTTSDSLISSMARDT